MADTVTGPEVLQENDVVFELDQPTPAMAKATQNMKFGVETKSEETFGPEMGSDDEQVEIAFDQENLTKSLDPVELRNLILDTYEIDELDETSLMDILREGAEANSLNRISQNNL